MDKNMTEHTAATNWIWTLSRHNSTTTNGISAIIYSPLSTLCNVSKSVSMCRASHVNSVGQYWASVMT